MRTPPRISLTQLPTPIEKLDRLSRHLGGPTIFVTAIAADATRIIVQSDVLPLLRVEANADYLGGGYSVVGDLERDAIRTVARLEGLLLPPVYTGRAMGGLFDLIRRGVFTKGQTVLFWHTGGAAALYAFADKL